jgi:uncharacterized protein HemX
MFIPTHTVIDDDRPRSSGAGWVIALVLIIAAVVGIYLFSQQSQSEIAENAAVAEAAESVSDAANEVGDAAKEVVDGQ